MSLTVGTKIRVKRKERGNSREINGKIIKEYPTFYLVQHENGYKETILKVLIKTGDIKIVEG